MVPRQYFCMGPHVAHSIQVMSNYYNIRDSFRFGKCAYSHSPLSFHFGSLLFFLFLLLLVHSTPLTYRPTENINSLRRRGGSLPVPARRGRVRLGSRARLSLPTPFGLSGFRAPLPLFVPGPRSRAASLFTVLTVFGMLGAGRAAAPRTTHFKRRQSSVAVS